MNTAKSIFHLITIIAVFAAVSSLISDLPRAETVFQQIEVFAQAMTIVVLPYCFARAIEQLAGR